MGLSCFEEDKSTNSTKDYGFDLEELYRKAEEDFRSTDIIEERKTYLINMLIINLLKKLIKK